MGQHTHMWSCIKYIVQELDLMLSSYINFNLIVAELYPHSQAVASYMNKQHYPLQNHVEFIAGTGTGPRPSHINRINFQSDTQVQSLTYTQNKILAIQKYHRSLIAAKGIMNPESSEY